MLVVLSYSTANGSDQQSNQSVQPGAVGATPVKLCACAPLQHQVWPATSVDVGVVKSLGTDAPF